MTLKREPALIVAFISAAIASLGLALGWSSEQVGLAAAVVSSVGAAYVAWKTVDTWASAIINVIAALIALAVGFNLSISDQAAALIIGVATTGLAMFNRTQVTPTEPSTAPAHFRTSSTV
jgi:hypothetical protein